MSVSNSLPPWEHALPYRVLIDELRVRHADVLMKVDVDELLNKFDAAQAVLKTLRDKEEPDLQGYQSALEKSAAAEKPLKDLLHGAELNALCFSGGGIRSASFGLGVLWQLARQTWKPPATGASVDQNGLLHKIDYVSTVSGGGYVGSWFTGWILRHPQGLNGVIKELAAVSPTSADPEPAPVRHLRDYTSYLAPRSGLLSPDTWTLAAIIVRNLLLNWSILLPAFAGLLLLPVLNTYAFSWAINYPTYCLWAAVAFAFVALLYIAWNLPGNYKVQPKKSGFAGFAVPLLVSAWCLSAYGLSQYSQNRDPFRKDFWVLWGLASAAHVGLLAGRVLAAIREKGRERRRHFVRNLLGQALAAVPSSAFAAWILWLMAVKVGPSLYADVRLFASLSVPLIWGAFALTVIVLNGLSVQFDAEEDREWWSRSSAFALMGIVLWPLAHLLVLYSQEIAKASEFVFRGKDSGTVAIPALTAVIGTLASLAGFNPATASSHSKVDFDKLSRTGKFLSKRKLLIPALGGLFFVLLAIALALANNAICRWIGKSPAGSLGIELLFAFALALIMNVFVNVNTFSLHAMYRGRLVRSYLGASNNKRQPNPFTNFDPEDNFVMKDAPAAAQDAAATQDNPATKDAPATEGEPAKRRAPLHIINMALNLVSTKKLAWQQRKAESFTVSALHSGSFRVGYQPTKQYAGTNGLTLGTAMAISGAAASPNMGYHSNPILSLVMTFFNARLGWWLPNPGSRGRYVWRKNSPVFSLLPLLNESLGRTTDENQWVYLSDGGHFENLGLYEMVMRRCARVIVVDGSCDPSFNMEDLGNAARKIHIDLGVPIEFHPPKIPIAQGAAETNHHCAVADIRYDLVDEGARAGELVYIKTSLNGQEPVDVQAYSALNPDFPHESTANQFFNESQFESYVRLGSHIVEEILGPQPPSPLRLGDFFDAAAGRRKAAAVGGKP